MSDLQKQLREIEERIEYLQQTKGFSSWGNLERFKQTCDLLNLSLCDYPKLKLDLEIRKLNDSVSFLEARAEEHLSPLERVRIARSVQRFGLKDILENVYDDYKELGEEEDAGVNLAMICAKATISRRIKNKPYIAAVMVIGQETGHGEEYRRNGSGRSSGNEKALKYMRVAETEGIPIHFYIFTPGSYPVEESPGTAQQVARNIYAMTKLRVPMISMISEGVSSGAEAIGLSDCRLMASHGYYTAIPPERAAAIEGKIDEGSMVPRELVEVCADRLKLTAEDNLLLGTIDRVIYEPQLGARRDDLAFFAKLKSEMVQATDKVVLAVKSFRALRIYGIRRSKHDSATKGESQPEVAWEINNDEIRRLLARRSEKYLEMGRNGFTQPSRSLEGTYYLARVRKALDDFSGERSVMVKRIAEPIAFFMKRIIKKREEIPQRLITYTGGDAKQEDLTHRIDPQELTDTYTSPLANADRTVSCPNAGLYNCKDLWVPDLYSDFAGACGTCGHHFPLAYEWYLQNIFDPGSISHFNGEISAGNPLNYTGFNERLQRAKDKTGKQSGNMTFHAKISGIPLIVSMLYSDFRNGTVGCAEGEKFVRACNLAGQKNGPLLAFIHSTSGIRIQEGTLAVTQMAKCTMAVREYIDAGGLYLVVYDNNSYAEPLASFLGCSHYQFAIRSSRVGFAGPRLIRETTGADIPPDYHSAQNALKRGNLQGVWDRRELRRNLHKALRTMGSGSFSFQEQLSVQQNLH